MSLVLDTFIQKHISKTKQRNDYSVTIYFATKKYKICIRHSIHSQIESKQSRMGIMKTRAAMRPCKSVTRWAC